MTGDATRRFAAACWLEHSRQLETTPTRALAKASLSSRSRAQLRFRWASLCQTASLALLVILHATYSSHFNTVATHQVEALETEAAAKLADQIVEQLPSSSALSQTGAQFDGTKFSSLFEAIRAHPDLHEFARLCELRGVKEIVSMDTTPLTIFAPVDRALADLLAKADARQLNLAELARHHIAQGVVLADNIETLPHQFQSYGQFSSLYLSRVARSSSPAGAADLLVNNAKILATYVIQIESDYQVLHLIDQALEFAYTSKRAPIQTSNSMGAGPSASGESRARSTGARAATIKRPLDLHFLASDEASEAARAMQTAIGEFHERFGDLASGQPEVDLYRARAHTNSGKRAQSAPAALQQTAAKWAKVLRADQERDRLLRGKLYQPESLNTYFLPVDSDELEQLLGTAEVGVAIAALQAHVIPNEVLFTRALALGHARASAATGVALSLAKSLPESALNQTLAGQLEPAELSRRLLATPLLLQAAATSAAAPAAAAAPLEAPSPSPFRPGVTSAEILVANIPLSHGVLHLIRRPLVVPSSSLLDFINDNERQLADLVQAAGSQTARTAPARLELNRFRELLARGDRQLLSTFSNDYANSNRTIFAPTDAAFGRLRYDLRALILNDELLIPSHWDASYRQLQLERLLKRHLVDGQSLTSQELAGRERALATTLNNFQLSFSESPNSVLQVQCDSTQANILHQDLLGSNGVLHLIDRVLGEELETVHSLLRSIVLKCAAKYAQLGEFAQSSPMGALGQLVESNLRSAQLPAAIIRNDLQPASEAHSQEPGERHRAEPGSGPRRSSPELQIISKSVEQFLGELGADKRQLLATSVNISLELARLSSRAEGRDDWNEKFKLSEKSFTYFVPTDLAWLRLVQSEPELYRPLVYFLEQQFAPASPAQQLAGSAATELAPSEPAERPRASESSHRLLQILERHLIGNKKLTPRDLNQLESVHSVSGQTLRLVAQQLNSLAGDDQTSSYAALHSIAAGGAPMEPLHHTPSAGSLKKALKLGTTSQANFVELYETSNGFVYLIDQVLTLSDDVELLVQTSSVSAITGTMSSLLGAHNSAILDAIQNAFASNGITSTSTMITLIGTLLLAIVMLTLLLLVLVVRRRRQTKLNRHQQLESGLTSSSSANSGSTSTTKSL